MFSTIMRSPGAAAFGRSLNTEGSRSKYLEWIVKKNQKDKAVKIIEKKIRLQNTQGRKEDEGFKR